MLLSSRLLSLFWLLSVLLLLNVGSALAIECGDVLTGGPYVLDHDLTCGSAGSTNPNVVGVTLLASVIDLNGHTLTCLSSQAIGIRIESGATGVRNGTVTGCRIGVLMNGDFQALQSMTLLRNRFGLSAHGGGGLYIDNRAIENSYSGLAIGVDQRTHAAQIINNVAENNGRYGFIFAGGTASIMGNTASSNEIGFDLAELDHAWVSGNLAIENSEAGFLLEIGNDRMVMENNTAFRNDLGFWFSGNRRVIVRDNLALENHLDGFFIQSLGQRLDMHDNSAFRNGQNGIEITSGAIMGHMPRTIRMRNNVSLGHDAPYFDLTQENDDCAGVIWQKNIFDTRSQACIK